MGWSPDCQKDTWDKWTLRAWNDWINALDKGGVGSMDKQGWMDWVDEMMTKHGPPKITLKEQTPPKYEDEGIATLEEWTAWIDTMPESGAGPYTKNGWRKWDARHVTITEVSISGSTWEGSQASSSEVLSASPWEGLGD